VNEDEITGAEENAEAAEEPKPEHPPCPTCGEEWDGDAAFCYYCGYQESDEDNPLHPTPVLDGGVCDAAGVLSPDEINAIKAVIAESGKGRPDMHERGKGRPVMSGPIMFAAFDTPDDQTPAGMAFTLYNDWTVGVAGADDGILIYYDPSRKRVEIALGKKIGRRINMQTVADAARGFAESIAAGRIADGFKSAIETLSG
jgi:hypothetical protein